MPFTDDDLNHLKKVNRGNSDTAFFEWAYQERIAALLARLEAAERIAHWVEDSGDGALEEECEAWRKSKGEK